MSLTIMLYAGMDAKYTIEDHLRLIPETDYNRNQAKDIRYYENSKKKIEYSVEIDEQDNLISVEQIFSDENGKIINKSIVKNGMGVMRSFEDNTIYEDTYNNGKIVKATEYRNEKKIKETGMKDGNPNGKYIIWNENEEKVYETNFKNGNGKIYEIRNSGEIITYELKNGIIDEEYKIEKNGIYILKEYYINGLLEGESSHYYENGKLESINTYKDGKLTGKIENWTEDGVYIKYENGKIKFEETYKNNIY